MSEAANCEVRDLPHALVLESVSERRGRDGQEEDVHKWVIDCDDKDLSCVLEFGVGDVARDVGVGTCWACEPHH